MPQVSRNPLTPRDREEMYFALWHGFTNLKREEDVARFLKDLLTTTERTMVAKRLAIALLLSKGYAYNDISRVAKVSTATIAKVREVLENGGDGYHAVLKMLHRKEQIDSFLRRIERLVGQMVPPQKHNIKRRMRMLRGL